MEDASGPGLLLMESQKRKDTHFVWPDFVQDNHSKSVRGVLRGLHYQLPPHAQGKLVRVVQGEVFDAEVF